MHSHSHSDGDGTIPTGSVPDPKRSELRGTVAAIERDLARLPPDAANDGGASPADGLRASVADLVRQLDLGPEPGYRQCPVCGHLGMRAASVCGYCWTKLAPAVIPEAGGR
jgi:hypothetical protein